MGQAIAVLDVGGTSIKTGVVRFDDGDDPRVDVGIALPANSREPADVVLDSLAAGADAALQLAGPEVHGLAIGICGPFDIEAGISRMQRGAQVRRDLRRRCRCRDQGATSCGVGAADPVRPRRRVRRHRRSPCRCRSRSRPRADDDRRDRLGTCLTDHARPVEFIDGFGVEHLAMRDTPWDGRADDVLSAHGLAERLGVAMADLRTAVEDPANADAVSDHGRRLGVFLRPVVAEFDAHAVVIGGGFSAAFDRFGPALQAAIGAVPVRPASLGTAGPLLGAAHLTFRL
jgi:predicted NBD/HSP70 family sugar kinase